MRWGRSLAASLIVLLGVLTLSIGKGTWRNLVPTVAADSQSASGLFTEKLLNAFTFRNVGPFRMQARASAVAVPAAPAEQHLYTFYLATWTGGVFKTTDGGTTFTPVFDAQDKLTIGAIAVAPSDANVVWVGTGDARGARSSFPGDGVYKSLNAGGTWTHMGLRDTQHISRIAIDPTNPNVVYVGAMGHLYSPNEERGVFKTTDGGKTWKRVFYLNDRVGVIDLVMNPQNPDVLYAATYDMRRTPAMFQNAGPLSGIFKTTDGGASWTKLGGGLPTGRIGKIGLDIYPRNPEILYAIINNDNPGAPEGPPAGCTGGQRAGLLGGQMYRTTDGGRTWTKMNSPSVDLSPKGSGYIGSGDEDCDGFTQVRVDPNNPEHVYGVTNALWVSNDGGKTWRGGGGGGSPGLFPGIFGDVRTLWIDPQNSNRMIVGDDGGFDLSYDGGESSRHIAYLPIGEPYSVGYDMDDPYNIYATLQDHETWKGPSLGPRGYTSLLDWVAISSGDGMHVIVDPTDSRWAYASNEWGSVFRIDQTLGYRVNIRPVVPEGGAPYRAIWGTPIAMSPFDSKTLYTGGQMLFKTVDRGDHWTAISPDLTTNRCGNLAPAGTAGVQKPLFWCAISTISESPLKAGLIWVGTSDGKVQVTRDDGKTWTDATAAIARAGGPEARYVSTVFASNFDAGRAYVSKDGNKDDDAHPYLYETDDYGATWKSIAGNLPPGAIHVVQEDSRNPNLLLVGSAAGLFVSIDRGNNWLRMNNNMPNVPVLDLKVQPRVRDLIVAGFGRGVFVTNIAALEQLNGAVLAKDHYLFQIQPVEERVTWAFGANDWLFAQAYLVTPNPPNGMPIQYYVKNASNAGAEITITDSAGKEVAKLQGKTEAGINTVVWDMLTPLPPRARRFAGRRRAPGYSPNTWMPLGEYLVTLEIGGQKFTRHARITKTQGWSVGPAFPQVIR